MGLEDVGVIFVSKGFADFMKNMSKAAAAITNMGNMTQNRLKALQMANDVMAKIAKSASNIAVSNDKLKISQQQTIQSTNNLKKAQEQVRTAQERTAQSANNSKTAFYNMQRGVAASAAELKKMDYNIVRLESIDKLNDALMQGTISLEQYTTAALATNNQLRQLGGTSKSASDQIMSSVQGIGSALGGLGGVFGNVSKWGNIGGSIGAAIGSAVPAIGTAIGGIAGYIMGALGGLGAGILNWFVKLGVSIGRSIINLGKQIIGWFKGIFNSLIGTIKGLLGTVFNLFTGGIFQSGWNNLGNTIVSSMFKFEILKEAIRKVVSEINELAGSAYEAAGNLQMYTARLNFLIASQVRFSDSTIDSARAMEIAANETQNLLRWEQKLALTSPVSIEDVNQTLSMGIAMGWNVKAAQDLTTSILNYTSAVGLGSEISERIIYNFAQMKNAGKVTGTELRDLARGAFIPVNKVLELMYQDLQNATDGQKKYTGSFQQFREEAAAGKVDVEGFFDAFNKYVGTYMPDAMEKMNYTIVAVKDNIRDLFKTLLGWNIVGPIVKQFTEPLKRLVDTLSSDKVILGAQRIGQGISFLVQGMKAGISAIVKSIGDLLKASGFALPTVRNIVMTLVKLGLAIKSIGEGIAGLITKLLTPIAQNINTRYGSTFNAMRGNFFKWGANLILSFAKGMMKAASGALTAVMKGITNLLTSWLKGHSPPKVAPDIDKWGRQTIDEYYGGFIYPDTDVVKKAKDSVTSTVQDIVNSANQAVSSTSTGTVSMPSMDFGAISGWLHTFSEADFGALDSVQSSLQDVLSVMVDLGQITQEQSGQFFVDISTNLMQALSDFNKTGQISTSIFDQLRNLGGTFGTELAELLDVQLQLAVATEQTANAQKAYDQAVKDSAKANIKVNKMVREYNNLLRKGANRAILKNQLKIVNASEYEYAAAKKAEDVRKEELDLAEERQKALEDSVKLQEEIIKQMTELVKAQKDATDGAGGMADAIASELDDLGNIDLGFDVTPPWTDEELQSWMTQAQNEFTKEWENIKKGWKDTWDKSFGADSSFQNALSTMKSAWSAFTVELGNIWNTFASAVRLPSWEELTAIWGQPLQKTVKNYGKLPGPNVPPEAVLNPETGNYEVTTYSNTFLDKIKETLSMLADAIKNGEGGVTGFLQRVARFILEGIASGLETMAADPGIQSTISRAISSVLDFIGGIISSDMPTLTMPGGEILPMFGPPAPGPLNRIASSLMTLLTNSLTTAVNALITNGTLQTLGGQIASALWEGIKTTLFPENWLRDAIMYASIPATAGNITTNVTGFKNLWDSIKDLFTPSDNDKNKAKTSLSPLGASIADGISNGLIDQLKITDFSSVTSTTVGKLNDAYDSHSPAKSMLPVGTNLAEGIAEGIKEGFGLIMWGTKLQPLIDQVKTFYLITGEGPSEKFVKIGKQMTDGMSKGILDRINSTTWSSILQPLINKVKDFFGIVGEGPSSKFSTIGSSLIRGLVEGIKFAIDIGIIEGGQIYNAFNQIVTAARSQYGLDNITTSPFYTMGVDMIQGIINGFESMIPTLISEWNSQVVDKLPEEMRDKYRMESPSKLFTGMGKNIVKGLVLGLQDISTVVDVYTAQSMDKLMPAISVPAPMSATPVYGGTTVSFGDTYINNDMDWAIFKSRVQRAITER